MNIQRFQASSAREALALARMAFGDNALILANRQLATGEVEVTATSEEAIGALQPSPAQATAPTHPVVAAARPAGAPASATALAGATPVSPAAAASDIDASVGADTERLAMSTLSFQDYVRERMARRLAEDAAGAPADAADPVLSAIDDTAAAIATVTAAMAVREPSAPVHAPAASAVAPAVMSAAAPAHEAGAPAAPAASGPVMAELQSLRELMEERFTTLSWLNQSRQEPVRSTLLLKLIRAGFSPSLSRMVLERQEAGRSPAEAVRDLMAALQGMLRTRPGPALADSGGTYAFVGATGVGKTTSIAKLATLCAAAHGAQSVGLITLDTQRAGAHEQLRAYGRATGVVAHVAHDRAALTEMLGLFSRKKLVLIDTAGVAPRDPRRADQLAMLEIAQVQRVLVLNAGAHGDTLDDMAGAFHAQLAVISKTDEAVKLGPVLDAAIRHLLVVAGVSCGQRVPQDWQAPDAADLVRQAMRAPTRCAFEPRNEQDMDFFLSPAECATAP